MSQQLIDFGSFPDDPTADAIRTAFQKTQQNFAELYSGAAGQAVYSVNRTPGAGITVNAPTGNVVVTANIACVQVETSTLSIGITANGGQNAVYTQSNQVLVIDLPNEVINIKDITISGNLTANRVTANIDMYTGTLSATGNANVANLNSANNVTGTNLTITNGMMSGNLTLGNLTMAGTVKSHLIPSPPNTQNLGNATNNWNALYAQDIYLAGTPISGIGKVVPSFGNVYLPSNVSVVGTTAGTATTVLTFTFPNSGYYRVNTLLIADPAIAGTPTVSFALFDNTGTLVPNSEIMMTTATGGISQKLTGTGVIDIQVSGAVSYTVRAWGLNTPNILNYGVDGRSSVNWLKLDPAATISTTGNVTYGNLTVTGQTSLNTLTTSGNANINANLNVSGNAIISGNLTVDGNIIYVNVEDLSIEDPIINLQTGPNGSPLVANSGKDVGVALNYFTSSPKVAWMGWDNSAAEITFGEDVTITSEVVSYTKYANIRAGNIMGPLANGSSNITIVQNANINFAVNGNGNRVEIGEANSYFNNQLWANSNIYVKNTGALVFQDDEGGTLDTYFQYNNTNNSVILNVNGNTTMESNISNTFFNSPLTANANLVIPNGNRIIFVDDVSTNNDTGINYNNTNDSLTITVNGVETIKSNVANTTLTGNVIISGNLAVDGNITYINTETLAIEDPIIQLQTGPNGAAPTSNSGKDIGTALNYYDSAARVAFMGWDTSGEEFGFASRATITNEVVAFDTYGNIRAGNVIARLANGTSNIYIEQNGPVLFSAQGTSNVVNVAAAITHVNNQLYANNNMFINNTGAGAFLYFVDNVAPSFFDTYIQYDYANPNLRFYINSSQKLSLNSAGANILNGNLTIDSGDAIINGGDILSNQALFNILPANATTITLGLAATSIDIGSASGTTNINNNLEVDGDILLKGGDFDVSTSSANLWTGNATTVNAFSVASTLNIGATGGVITLANPTLIGTQTTQNVYNNTATTVNAFGEAATLNIGNTAGTVTLRNPTLVGTENTQNVYNTVANTVNAFGFANVINMGKDEGTMTLRNPTLVGANVTQNVYNTTATTVNAFGTAATLNVGVDSGTVTLRNPTLVGANVTQNVYNTVAATVNAFGDANVINMGKDEGIMTLRNPTIVGANVTQNLFNTVATTVNFAGSATNVNIASSTGNTTVKNNLVVNGNLTVDQDIIFSGCDIDANCVTLNVFNNIPQTINLGANASTLNIGNTTGTATLRNPTLVGTETTQNVYNTTATTVNAFGAAATLNIGVDSGTITLRNPTLVGANATQNLYNTVASTIYFGGSATNIFIGNTGGLTTFGGALLLNDANTATINFKDANGSPLDTAIYYNNSSDNYGISLNGQDKIEIFNSNTTIHSNLIIDFDLAVNGGDITSNQATFNLLNVTPSTINFGANASILNIGNTTGTVTLRNPTLVGSQTTQNVYDTVATTVNAFGTAGTLNIGNNTGTATLRNPTLVGTETTQNVYNTTATTVNAFGTASTLNLGNNTGTATLRNPTLVGTETTQNVYNTTATTVNAFGAAATLNVGVDSGTVTLRNPTLVGANVTQNVYNTTATTVNAFGAAATLNVGVDSGTVTLRNPTLVGANVTQNVYNTIATTVNAFGDANSINIGTNTSLTTLRGNLQINKAINFVDSNSPTTDTSIYYTSDYLGIALNGSPDKITIENTQVVINDDLAVKGGDITTNQATFNILNGTATTVNAFGAASTLNMGATTGTATLRNPTLVGTETTQNIYNTTATTVNAFGAASTLNMGTTSGTATLRNPTLVGTETTQNVYNTTATTVNAFGAASTLNLGATSGTATINNPTVVGSQATQNLFNTAATTMNFAGAATTVNTGAAGGGGTFTIRNDNVVMNGDLQVQGGDLTTTAATFNLLNATATTINFAGAATTLEIGAASGTTNINNNLDVDGNALVNGNLQVDLNGTITGDLAVNGGDITTTSASFNLVNATATTVNFAGAGTDVNIGAATGNTTIKNNLVVTGNISLDADIILKGCDLNTDCTTFNLINANATTVFFAGAATSMNIGANGVSANIRGNLSIDKAINFNTISSTNDSIYYNSATFNIATGGVERLSANATVVLANANLQVTGTEITTNAAAVNLANTTTTTINFGGAATTLNIGAATGNTTIKNNLIANGNIETVLATLNLANANSTTVNFAGAGTAINIGAVTGNTTVNHNLIANGNIETKLTTLNLANANSTTINFGGAGTAINIGAATGNTTVNHNLIANGNIETKLTTLNLANANSTTINFGGAGTQINVGASTGNTKVNNNLIANGNIETVLTTLNLANANSTTVNFAGAGTNINIGASSGNTTIKNNLIANGNIETVLTTLNLANANSTTINFGGAATTMKIGKSGTSYQMPGNLAIDKSINFNTPASLNDAIYFNSGFFFSLGGVDKFFVNASGTTSNANLYVNGTDIITSQSSFNIANTTATTINLGRAASQLNFGASGSNSAFSGNVYVTGNINVNGGGIDGPATMNIGSTSSTIQMGSSGGVVTMNGNANVTNLNASANVVATTAVKTGSITLNGGNGFIYTSGDITGNTISASGLAVMYPNGLITGASVSTGSAVMYSNGTIQASLFSGSGASLSSLPGANVTGTVANATYATSAGSASTATSATSAGFATNSGYATSAGTAGFASCAGALVGSGCDVAEFYAADEDYEVGTVLEFGGDYDVTLSSNYDSHKVAGVISTEPGVTLGEYVEFDSDNKALLALIGRVPTKVIGPVEKGDLMVSAPDGYAIANNMARAGTIIGKSLENFYGDRGVIDIVVGRH
jgi:hypothetical protein